ncbi:helix-turn-helix transcriptional regulator [Streptomyces sp. NPDC020799]|uniref:helix-turn-helix transcriptional regulator n=1 Tax=Streptomyces sp. NPDC020799 TaxID=3365091 RepID=UPI0037994AF1
MDDPIRHPLAYARLLRGWSQNDLVARLHRAAAMRPEGLRSGTDKAAVSKWENGRKTPNIESQLLIAEPSTCRSPTWSGTPGPTGSRAGTTRLRSGRRTPSKHFEMLREPR